MKALREFVRRNGLLTNRLEVRQAAEIDGKAARRELGEETGLTGVFPTLAGAFDGVPPGYLGYEEHQAGNKGLHMNFVFVADVADDADVAPNHEFTDFRWVDAAELDAVQAPRNVRQFGHQALSARAA